MTDTRRSFDNGIQVAWDATSLSTFLECPQKYYWRIVRQRAPRARSVHLLFGGALASALEHYYKHRAGGLDHDAALLLVVREALDATWLDREIFAANSLKSRRNLIRAIVWYLDEEHERPSPKPETIILSDGRPAVELSFAFEAAPGITLCGHLDRLVSFQGMTYVMDQKTTGSTISQRFFDQFKLSPQMSLYAIAGQIVFKSPVQGVVVDGIQIAQTFIRVQRGFIHKTPEALEEFLDEAIEAIRRAQAMTEAGRFPHNPTACTHYGRCPYFEICASNPGMREQMARSLLEPAPWDPIEPRQ